MSKIAILNDTHIGYKNSSQIFLDYMQRFFEEVFFPYCEKEGIDTILHLGDIFDHRKHVSVKALHFTRTFLLNQIRERGMKMHILPGNHDIAYKNSLELCSMFEILQHYTDCVTIHMNPEVVEFEGTNIGLVPWMAPENMDECVEFIQTAETSILAGHFEIAGFRYIANSNMKSSGFNKETFKRYDMVLSGHYHTKSNHGNITYLGSQYQFNWSDVDDRKYFHVLDTSSRDLIPVENPLRLYTKFYYDDSKAEKLEDIIKKRKHNKRNIEGNYVRVVVTEKKDYHIFDQFITFIKGHQPFDLQIIENFDEFLRDGDEGSESIVIEDTATLLLDFVDNNINTNLDKELLKKYLNELYTEAMINDSI